MKHRTLYPLFSLMLTSALNTAKLEKSFGISIFRKHGYFCIYVSYIVAKENYFKISVTEKKGNVHRIKKDFSSTSKGKINF